MTDQPNSEPTVDLSPASDPLDAGLAAAFASAGEPSTSPPVADGPGSRIGPYKLLQQIGEGGAGACLHDRTVRTGASPRRAQSHQAGDGHAPGRGPL